MMCDLGCFLVTLALSLGDNVKSREFLRIDCGDGFSFRVFV